MGRYAIDAVTLVHVLESGQALDPAHQWVAPGAVRSQASELLLRRVRAGELSEAAALRLHEQLARAKLRLLNDRMSRRTAWNIALAQGWDSIRDAEYLAVTRLQADALVTIDQRLAAAAAGIAPVRSPSEIGVRSA